MKIDMPIEAWHRLAEAAEAVGRAQQHPELLRDAALIQHKLGLTATSASNAAMAERLASDTSK